MAAKARDIVEMLWERDKAVRDHHAMRTGRDMPKPFTLEGQAAEEIERLRSEVAKYQSKETALIRLIHDPECA